MRLEQPFCPKPWNVELTLNWWCHGLQTFYADCNARKGGVGWGTRTSWKRKASKKGLCQTKLSEDFPFFDCFFNQDPRKSTCEVGWQQQFCAKTSQQPGRVLEGQVLWEVYWFNLRNQSREIGHVKTSASTYCITFSVVYTCIGG